MLTTRAGQRRADRRAQGDHRRAAGSRRARPAPRTSTRSTPRASAARTTCAASRRKPRPSSTPRSRRRAAPPDDRATSEASRQRPMSETIVADQSSQAAARPHGRRGLRCPGRAGPGPALVVESRRRRGLAAARSGALGAHPQSLGRPADRLAGEARARPGRSRFPRDASTTWCRARRRGGGGARVVSASTPAVAADAASRTSAWSSC